MPLLRVQKRHDGRFVVKRGALETLGVFEAECEATEFYNVTLGKQRERQRNTTRIPKCGCGNCLALNNTTGRCAACESFEDENAT